MDHAENNLVGVRVANLLRPPDLSKTSPLRSRQNVPGCASLQSRLNTTALPTESQSAIAIMSAFAALTSPLFFHNPFHGTVCKHRLQARLPHATMSTAPVMLTPGEGEAPQFEDDEATMGTNQKSHGIRLPNFTKEDQDYLNAACSSDEYVARMMDLAKKKDRDRKIANAKSGAQTADDYVESLKRKPADLSDQPYDSKGTSASSDYMESLNVRQPPDLSGGLYDSKGINAGEEYIRQINAMHEQSAVGDANAATSEFDDASGERSPDSDSSTRSVERVQDFQTFLRQSAGVSESDLSPEKGVDINRIDDDIDELEARLRKVVREENADGSPAVPTAEDMEALDRKFKEIRSHMPGYENEAKSTNKTSGDKPADGVAVVDKQIGFLENYLQKLKREQEAETGDTSTAPQVDNSDNTLGDKSEINSWDEGAAQVAGSKHESQEDELGGKLRETMEILSDKVDQQPWGTDNEKRRADALSDEEKMEAFEAIRREVMKQRGQMNTENADPLAASLPEKKSDVPRVEEEDDDVDLSSAKIPDGYFVLSELEAEIKRYLFDARSMLDNHEKRIESLLRHLKDLE